MELPNQYFEDYPVKFKEINPSDFPEFLIENDGAKVIISPNEDGYITKELVKAINTSHKNTVVVNAGVGQGKTTAIIEVVKKLYKEDYLIFIAAPFVSLVEQYFKEVIKKGIPESDIYRYEYIGESNISYLDKKIHIITVNSLLGNPGEDAYINSEAKREYLNSLSNQCKKQGKKVVIVMDEIHDAIHNFKEEYIFNLWKWKPVLHKNIILSATYNEASKIVIEYLAELTDSKIRIIESKRIRIPNNQSDLYLHYNPALFYNNENEQIVEVVKNVIKRGKEVDILCYSKNLADAIITEKNKGIGKVLYSKYQEINNCTSDLRYNQRLGKLEVPNNRYNDDKCNVGTNFKTGVSISKSNHAFVIIFPPKGAKLPFKNASGIFSDGINSVIQSLARQRKKGGEIHLILPPPEKFDFKTLPFKEIKKERFIEFYESIRDLAEVKVLVKYVPYHLQEMLLVSFYESELKEGVKQEIDMVNNADRVDKASLKFPDFKSFKLRDGEGYLNSKFKFLGTDLSAFITYSAITNQFLNCNLKGYTDRPKILFKEGAIQKTLDSFFINNYLSEDRFFVYSELPDLLKYLEFKNDIFNNYKLIIEKESGAKSYIKKNTNRCFEMQLLGFMLRKFHPTFNESFFEDEQLVDYQCTRSDYFLLCISKVGEYNIEGISHLEELKTRIITYQSLRYFRGKLIDSIVSPSESSGGNFTYLPNKPTADFITNEEHTRFNQMINYLVNEDYFISNSLFEFKKRFKSTDSTEKKIASFYTKMIEDFLETESYRLSRGRRIHVKKVNRIKPLLNADYSIDLIDLSYTSSETFEYLPTYNVIEGKLVRINPS